LFNLPSCSGSGCDASLSGWSDDQGVLGDLWLINQKSFAFNDLEIRLVQQQISAIAIRQAFLTRAVTAQVEENSTTQG